MKTTATIILAIQALGSLTTAAANPTDLPLGVEVIEEAPGNLVVREVVTAPQQCLPLLPFTSEESLFWSHLFFRKKANKHKKITHSLPAPTPSRSAAGSACTSPASAPSATAAATPARRRAAPGAATSAAPSAS